MKFKFVVNTILFSSIVFSSCTENNNHEKNDLASSIDSVDNVYSMQDSLLPSKIETGLKTYFSSPQNNRAWMVDYSQDDTYFNIESIDTLDNIYVVWSNFSMGSPCNGTQISTFDLSMKIIDCESFFTECDCPSECEGCGFKFIKKHSYKSFTYTDITDNVIERNTGKTNECEDCDCIIMKNENTSNYHVNATGQIIITNAYSSDTKVGSQYTQTMTEQPGDSVKNQELIWGIASVVRTKINRNLNLWNKVYIEDIRSSNNSIEEGYVIVIPIDVKLPTLKLKVRKSDDSNLFGLEDIINRQYWDYDRIRDGYSMYYPFEVAFLYPPIEKAKLVNPTTMNDFPENINADLVKVALDTNQDNHADLLFCEFTCGDTRLPAERGLHNCSASYVWSEGKWSITSSENFR